MTMYWLTIAESFLRQAREQLRSEERVLELPLGLHRTARGLEFLAPAGVDAPLAGLPHLRLARLPDHLEGISHLFWYAYPLHEDPAPRIDLALFDSGAVSAALLCAGRILPLREIRVSGRGMEILRPGAGIGLPDDAIPADGAFSRYAGALGGRGVHARLRALSAALIGVSRLGAPLALALAKAGLRRLVLIDDDRLEEHHLDAMEMLGPEALGAPKVRAVARALHHLAPQVRVQALQLPLEHPVALRAALSCDLLASAPDRGGPRLLASLCAAAYHRVHLDVGTGVFRAGEELEAGADIRLVLPGEGCLLCTGGLDLDAPSDGDWRRERAGSLRSLNGLAVSQALFLLERLVAGDVEHTTWTRLSLDRQGALAVQHPAFERRAGCPLCSQEGKGDSIW